MTTLSHLLCYFMTKKENLSHFEMLQTFFKFYELIRHNKIQMGVIESSDFCLFFLLTEFTLCTFQPQAEWSLRKKNIFLKKKKKKRKETKKQFSVVHIMQVYILREKKISNTAQ